MFTTFYTCKRHCFGFSLCTVGALMGHSLDPGPIAHTLAHGRLLRTQGQPHWAAGCSCLVFSHAAHTLPNSRVWLSIFGQHRQHHSFKKIFNSEIIWEIWKLYGLQEHYKALLHMLHPHTDIYFFHKRTLQTYGLYLFFPQLYGGVADITKTTWREQWGDCRCVHTGQHRSLGDTAHLFDSAGFGFPSVRFAHSLEGFNGGTRQRKQTQAWKSE